MDGAHFAPSSRSHALLSANPNAFAPGLVTAACAYSDWPARLGKSGSVTLHVEAPATFASPKESTASVYAVQPGMPTAARSNGNGKAPHAVFDAPSSRNG